MGAAAAWPHCGGQRLRIGVAFRLLLCTTTNATQHAHYTAPPLLASPNNQRPPCFLPPCQHAEECSHICHYTPCMQHRHYAVSFTPIQCPSHCAHGF
ncbi:hypothetical protein GQ54DRAFT_297524, partial [Martensiomyces pterosporus]